MIFLRSGLAPALLLGAVLLAAGSAAAATVGIGGTGSALAALRQLAPGFEATHRGVSVEIPSSLGTSGGIRAVAAGAIDLSVAARPLTPAEREAGLRAVPWGRTPLMVVVSPRVTEESIDFNGLADIFAGRREQWADGTPITPVLRPPSDSDSLQLAAAAPVLAEALAAAHARPGMLVAVTDQDAGTTIASASGAIGTLTLLQTISEGNQVRPLTLAGQRPDLATLAAGRYPLSREYWLIVGPHPSAEARALLEYLTGPAVTKRLPSLGMIPAPAQ